MVTPWGCKLDTWHWIGIQIDQIECMFWEISPVILNSRLKKTNKGHKTARKVRFSGFSRIFEDGVVTLFGWLVGVQWSVLQSRLRCPTVTRQYSRISKRGCELRHSDHGSSKCMDLRAKYTKNVMAKMKFSI